MKNLYGNRAVITGASSGIGKAIGEMFAANGIHAIGISRSGKPFDGCMASISADVTDDASIKAGMEKAIEMLGGIDILVNCAGSGIAGAVEDISADELAMQLDVNLLGAARATQLALPHMREAGNGIIINIGSVAGRVSIPFQSSYSASKYALEAITDALRIECKPYGIKACTIEPGDTRTGFTGSRMLGRNAGPGSVYHDAMKNAVYAMEQSELKGYGPDKVAAAACSMLGKASPPARRPVGWDYRLMCMAVKLLPSRVIQYALGIMYGKPAPGGSDLSAR